MSYDDYPEELKSKIAASRRRLENEGYTTSDGYSYENPNNYKEAWIDSTTGQVNYEM